MKTGKIFKLITTAVLAFGLVIAPSADIPFLRDFGITASAATSGTVGTLSWNIEGGTLKITGTGEMPLYS